LTHLTITYRDGLTTAYQDGKSLTSVDSLHGGLSAWTPGPLVLGADSRGRSPWQGTVEALALYRRCLESGEVELNLRNYQLLKGGQP
jgi:hypothetical protein